MTCYAEQKKITRPAEGISGIRPICVATSAGSIIGDIIMKTCRLCKETKPLSEFYKAKTYYQTECKLCRRKQIEKYSGTERGKLVARKARERYAKTAKYKATIKRYQQSEKGKDLFRRLRIRHLEKHKARDAVNHAITAGNLLPAHHYLCSCGEQSEQYHHPSYAPEHGLDVLPTCRKCHNEIHHKENNNGRSKCSRPDQCQNQEA